MSTDKTLADVQPGGRVRLGDQAERARFEAWAECAGYALTQEDGRYEFAATRCAWTAWRASAERCHMGSPEPAAWVPPNFFKKGVVAATARRNPPSETAVELRGEYIPLYLSAQPSPGGQDALDCIGRIEEAIEFRVPHDIYAAIHGELSELKAALAARQPVGEPEPYVVGNQYFTQAGDLVRFVAVHNEGTSYECMEDESGVNRYTRRDFGRVTGSAHDYSNPRNTPPLYSAPTAQAVDLGKLRLLGQRIEQVGRNAAPAAQGSGNVYFRNVIDWGRELLALIDGKAVGNG